MPQITPKNIKIKFILQELKQPIFIFSLKVSILSLLFEKKWILDGIDNFIYISFRKTVVRNTFFLYF